MPLRVTPPMSVITRSVVVGAATLALSVGTVGVAAASPAPSAVAHCDAASSGPPSASIPPDLQPDLACRTPYTGQGHPHIEHPWKCAASVAAGALGISGSWSARRVMRKGAHFATRWAPGVGEAAAAYGAYSAYSDCR